MLAMQTAAGSNAVLDGPVRCKEENVTSTPVGLYQRRHSRLSQASSACRPGKEISEHHTIKLNGIPKGGRDDTNAITSSSDSGTEADDEKGAFLLTLPRPPVRPRKGLKYGSDSTSPLLTPSYLDDERRKTRLENSLTRRASVLGHDAEQEKLKLRKKFRLRRKAELIRRLTETALLSTVTCLVLWDHVSWPCSLRNTGCHAEGSNTATLQTRPTSSSVYIFAVVLSSLYTLYPLRIVYNNHALNTTKGRWPFYIHLPAAFDPATLLYPVLIPMLIAISITPTRASLLLPNLALGLSSVPSKIIPYGNDTWYSSPQWVLSLLPIALRSEVSLKASGISATGLPSMTEVEGLSLLYPLHQTLMPILQYMTTTSLLPTELQLLSTSLINVLLFSESPQANILKAILWLGGVGVIVLCSKPIIIGVALAKIPSWRYRKSQTKRFNPYTIMQALDDSLHGKPSLWFKKQTDSESSDTDIFQTSADEAGPLTVQCLDIRRPFAPSYVRNLMKGFRNYRNLRYLTISQAMVLRWCLAIYTYIVVIGIITFFIRPYVAKYALSGSEPVIWALGYLFAEIPSFRHAVASYDLTPWIVLPIQVQGNDLSEDSRGLVGARAYLGAANTRLTIIAYCGCIIMTGLIVVLQLTKVADVDTRRKVFHGMMVVMFLPTIFIDPAFISLAFILILSIFLLLDTFRASQMPPLSRPLTTFLAPYVDGRDHRGPVVVSHIFLLIGCAIPLWLSLAATERSGEFPWRGWDVINRDLSMVAGIICVGMGDAAASLIGRRYGRRRWCWTGGKSLEGSLAFTVVVVSGLSVTQLWLIKGGWHHESYDPVPTFLAKTIVAGCGASLTEAVLTGANDNVVVPVILWLLIRGLRL